MDLSEGIDSARPDAPAARFRLLAGVVMLMAAGIGACSDPPYETLDHDTDLTGAYAAAFAAACDTDCGVGRFVYVVVSPTDESVAETIIESTPAAVATAISPIAVRGGLDDGEVATVFSVEAAVIEDDVAIIRIGRSEVTDEISSYVGRDYLASRDATGRWVLRTSEDTGITTTTAIG